MHTRCDAKGKTKEGINLKKTLLGIQTHGLNPFEAERATEMENWPTRKDPARETRSSTYFFHVSSVRLILESFCCQTWLILKVFGETALCRLIPRGPLLVRFTSARPRRRRNRPSRLALYFLFLPFFSFLSSTQISRFCFPLVLFLSVYLAFMTHF